MTYKPFMQFFVKGKRPVSSGEFSWLTGFEDYLGDAESIEVARYRKEVLEKHGYTEVEIWQRPLPHKVE